MRTGFLSLGLALLAATVTALPALAHHSTAMFDFSKTIELKGTVKSFQWTNPHTWTVVTVGNAEYGLEGMSPNYLSRNGWTRHTLNTGDKVTLQVYRLKNGRKGGFMVSVILPDGKLLYNLPKRANGDAASAAAAVQGR
jgi:Family of unknown function (DUF6152)